MDKFRVVLLGSDINAYGFVRSFWKAYKVKPYVVCKEVYPAIGTSKLVASITEEKKLYDDKVFLDTLKTVYKTILSDAKNNIKVLLIPCSDTYAELISRNQKELSKEFTFFTNPYTLFRKLGDRDSFYKLCKDNKLSYPKTSSITKKKHGAKDIPRDFNFPLILKPSDPVQYFSAQIKNKRKVYLVRSEGEFNRATSDIYKSKYKADFTVQEYIDGDQSLEGEIHAYSDQNGKVVFMQFNRVLLEKVSPQGIGSYAAVITGENDDLYKKIKSFLENISYKGFSNFDLKYSEKDGQWKFFEINQRPSQSSFTIDCVGYSIARLIVEDLIEKRKTKDTIFSNKKILYTLIPKCVVLKYSNKKFIHKIKSYYHSGNVKGSFLDKNDRSLKRYILHMYMQFVYVKQFKQLFGKSMLLEDVEK